MSATMMPQVDHWLVPVLLGYLLGSLPIGPWIGRLVGVDVQRQGSGNSGATNVARTVGKLAGIATLLGDSLKGFVAVEITRYGWGGDGLACVAALSSIFGHSYSLFLRFTGGKGVATAFGGFLGLVPSAAAISVLVFVLVARVTRVASLASMSAAVSLPLACLVVRAPSAVTGSAAAAALFVVAKHRDNLRRLADGTEPKFQ